MSVPRVRVLYGSETGNAERVAEVLTTAARARGLDVTLGMLDDVAPADLAAEECLLVVCSTTGEGDMPYNADRFWVALSADSAPRLDGMPFAVLGLGDSGYFDFCQAAVDLDNRFDELGAQRLRELHTCDFDYEDAAAQWTTAMVELLAGPVDGATSPDAADAMAGSAAGSASEVVAGSSASSSASASASAHHHPPRTATVLANRRLSGAGSLKEVRHLALTVDPDEVPYRAGDSLGVLPVNDPGLVDELLAHLGETGGRDLTDGRSLREALTSGYEISRPSRELTEEIGRRTRDRDLAALLGGADRRALHEFLWARDVLDLLRLAREPALSTDELLGLLRPLSRRSYSISSSPLATPGQVDLTVATLRYRHDGRDRGGVCSTHLADRIGDGAEATVVLEPNELFRPPADDDTPMIMVGPGTGVAPFRAFLQERRARGARGPNWLIYGGRHRRCDLLYGDEFATMERHGLLSRWDLAFSRDQPHKVYVQDRMREQGKRLHEWLEEGARLYICGDALHMAGDVERALHEIVAEHGGRSADEAADHIADLKRNHRYVRDVY
jgi:sulfite reductase (NADPH) flavoprotein alpha-component